MKDKIKLIISLLKLVRPFFMIMLLAIILGVLGHLTATFITVFIILAFCKVISFSLAVKLIILCAFSRGILRYIEQACNHYIAFKVLAHIRHLVFEKLRELAPAKLENEDKGNIIAMLTSDVELLEVFFAHTISPVMIAFIYSIIMICFIDSYHFVFGILAFVCYGIMGILIPYITYKVSQKEGSNYRFLLANYNTFILETVLGKREIIQFSQQETRFEQMMDYQNNLTQTHQKLIKHQSFQQILSDGLIILSIVISILLIKNHVSKELLIPMMALSSSFGPTIALANLANNLNQVFPCARRILNLLDEEPLLKEITNKNTTLNLPIEVKNLSFHYPNTSTEILHQINYTFEFGKTYGLLGKSGCGKSTLLKLMTKIIYPNEGTIETHGKLTSLLELGAGFHQDFTGRENIYFNAAVFGLTKAEIEKRVDDIIEFSELGEFIDNPVRTYSSGMYMRLAFSIAINVDAEILLIDEILAVGDQHFQDKCFDKLKELRDSDKTIVIVSHSLDTVKDLCTRAVWIYKGEFKLDGDPTYVIDEYLKQVKLDHKEEAKKKYQKPLDTYHGIVVVDIPQSFAEVKKDTAQFTISGWSLSDCLNDRLKVTFDDQEVTEMRKINRSDVLMAYQEKYGGYGTNDDECGFDYFVDVSQMELGEHSILVQLLDEKDKVISEKDLKINII